MQGVHRHGSRSASLRPPIATSVGGSLGSDGVQLCETRQRVSLHSQPCALKLPCAVRSLHPRREDA